MDPHLAPSLLSLEPPTNCLKGPDYVVLSDQMGDLAGFELCRQFKQLEGCQIKIVILANYLKTEDVEEFKAHGADDYVVKTTDGLLLRNALEKLIKTE